MRMLKSKSFIATTAALGFWLSSAVAMAEETTTSNQPATSKMEQSETQPAKEGIAQKLDDATTTARVKSRLILDKQTGGLSINVDTHLDEVTLNGTVKSNTERAIAEQIARETKGVRNVQNHLKVASTEDGDMTKLN